MSDRGYEFLRVKCANCQDELIRIKESETDDMVYCPTCMSHGDYERVVKQGAGLIYAHAHSTFLVNGFCLQHMTIPFGQPPG